ncbi:MAG: biotin--[acetyl-CoA-carboxylase] ligase [Spirochaetaceae bacterium]|nr:biotin--[acetyl-CoA-carboxylase] ligase [Spirochaetaceae bacterium]
MDIKQVINPFGPIFYQEETTSTMLMAKEQPQLGGLYLTNYQNLPQARVAGRTWFAGKGLNLTFTLALANNFNDPPSLLCGLAVSNLLNDLGISNTIKWPNDILVNDKKICGILCRLEDNLLHIGIGLNVNEMNFPADINATSLALETGRKLNREDLLNRLLNRLQLTLTNPDWLTAINRRLWRRGQKVNYQVSGGQISGLITNIAGDGALVLKLADGSLYNLYAGEAE